MKVSGGRNRRAAMQAAERRRIAAADPDPIYAGRYFGETVDVWPLDIETSTGQVTAAQPAESGRRESGEMHRQLDATGQFYAREAGRASRAIRHGEDRIFKGVTVSGHEDYVAAQTDDLITAALGIAQHIVPVTKRQPFVTTPEARAWGVRPLSELLDDPVAEVVKAAK
jgi:hypothetical protein